ncbi:hypothetical protein GGR50DRAFT_680387 [Xylaria sp. CBS 124048]|nr:hypothetical protein GGR50DRAFT_680387 [Xylaria sp. CBS 124048]
MLRLTQANIALPFTYMTMFPTGMSIVKPVSGTGVDHYSVCLGTLCLTIYIITKGALVYLYDCQLSFCGQDT